MRRPQAYLHYDCAKSTKPLVERAVTPIAKSFSTNFSTFLLKNSESAQDEFESKLGPPENIFHGDFPSVAAEFLTPRKSDARVTARMMAQ
jgi:hypothetical protein